MRPPLVSPQEIIEAGEALMSAGRPVSGHSLRQRIGKGKPERLLQVWKDATGADGAASTALAGTLNLERQVAALQEELERERGRADLTVRELETVKKRSEMTQLVVDAVSDQLSKSKLLVSSLESKTLEQSIRISELHARIDEQRSELNRAARSSLSLEMALQAINQK
jgi:colicin import membrane protein